MATETSLITAEQFASLPDSALPIELVKGNLVEMNPPMPRHGEICSNVDFLLRLYLNDHPTGRVVTNDANVLIKRNPDTVRGADWAFVARSNLPGQNPEEAFWPGPPDMAVEVLSPGDRAGAVREKNEAWLAAGVKLLWVVDPDHETVAIYRSPADVIVKTATDTLDGGDILPGFHCRVAEIFTPIA